MKNIKLIILFTFFFKFSYANLLTDSIKVKHKSWAIGYQGLVQTDFNAIYIFPFGLSVEHRPFNSRFTYDFTSIYSTPGLDDSNFYRKEKNTLYLQEFGIKTFFKKNNQSGLYIRPALSFNILHTYTEIIYLERNILAKENKTKIILSPSLTLGRKVSFSKTDFNLSSGFYFYKEGNSLLITPSILIGFGIKI